ncbi:MAG: NHL repeat-containing protein [Betaproteobacteria bacterium]
MTDLESRPVSGPLLEAMPAEAGEGAPAGVDGIPPTESRAFVAEPAVEEPPDALVPNDRDVGDDESGNGPGGDADGASTGPDQDGAVGTPITAVAPRPKDRRRRLALLVLLAIVAAGMLLFAAWYLVTRKPISELPLPGLTTEAVPHFAYSVYGVTAPTGVAVTADGSRIYVTQTEGDPSVLVFDGKGTSLGALEIPQGLGTSHVPVYVAINPTNGDVYVSDRPTGSILVFGADGTFRRVFEPGKSLIGWQPLGLGFDASGDLYVTDVSGPFNTVHEFASDATLVRTIGAAGQFNFPNGVAVDSAGNVYVTDSNNGRLVVFDPSGKQRAVVRRGSAAGDLGLPRGAAIDDSGRIYVADTSGQGVQLYHVIGDQDAPPAYIGRFGSPGFEDGAFQFPNGVAVDGRARIYVTDWRNNRVQVWTY